MMVMKTKMMAMKDDGVKDGSEELNPHTSSPIDSRRKRAKIYDPFSQDRKVISTIVKILIIIKVLYRMCYESGSDIF